jgi:limonene-1,2-epoxide hydrolase
MKRNWAGLALAAVVFGGFALTSTSAEAATAAATDPRIAVVNEMVAAWNARDWDKVVNLFADDGVLHSMMLEPIVGRKSIDARIKHMGAGISQIRLNVKHMGLIDGVVYVERVDEFVYNGHAGSVPVMGAIEVKDGRVKAWREYYDRKELLTAMGIAEDFDKKAR